MKSHLNEFFQNVGPLSVSILEHYVSQVVGDKAIGIIKEPYERDRRINALIYALEGVEGALRAEKDGSLILNLQQDDFPGVIIAAERFERDINFDLLRLSLYDALLVSHPDLPAKTASRLAERYAGVLREKIIATSSEPLSDRISATALLEILGELKLSRDMVAGHNETHRALLERIVSLLEKISSEMSSTSQHISAIRPEVNLPTVATYPTTLPKNILVITVTKVETQAVMEAFQTPDKQWIQRNIGKNTYYDLGIHDGAPVFMAQSEMGVATPGGTLITVNDAIRDLYPQAVISCGIAFGLRPDKQKLGDILVSQQLEYYEPQKLDFKRGHIQRGDRATASERLLHQFRSGDNNWKGAQTHFGLVLSGEKLVNSSDFRDWLLEIEPEAIGGEMEGAGLYVAARNVKVDWILVKSICDWADGTKNDDAQPLAARNAAQFVLHVLQQGGSSEPLAIPTFPSRSASLRDLQVVGWKVFATIKRLDSKIEQIYDNAGHKGEREKGDAGEEEEIKHLIALCANGTDSNSTGMVALFEALLSELLNSDGTDFRGRTHVQGFIEFAIAYLLYEKDGSYLQSFNRWLDTTSKMSPPLYIAVNSIKERIR